MGTKRAIGWLVLGCVVAMGASAGADDPHRVPTSSPELERIKSLAGRWQGASKTGDNTEPAVVEYKVTAGGSAVVETLFPGTAHEMVSVYHDQNGKLTMTHYCMLGNQPQLKLVGADNQHLNFSLAKSPGIDVAKDQHMHALTVAWQGSDHLTQTWSCYEGGKPHMTTTITLSRLK